MLEEALAGDGLLVVGRGEERVARVVHGGGGGGGGGSGGGGGGDVDRGGHGGGADQLEKMDILTTS